MKSVSEPISKEATQKYPNIFSLKQRSNMSDAKNIIHYGSNSVATHATQLKAILVNSYSVGIATSK